MLRPDFKSVFRKGRTPPNEVDMSLASLAESEGGDLPSASPAVDTAVSAPLRLIPESGWSIYGSEAPEQSGYYTDRERVWLSGTLAGGDVFEGTPLFTLPLELAPAYPKRLPTLSDGGPAVVEVGTDGVGRIGTSPFVCGSGWLLLEGLSYSLARLAPDTWQTPELTWKAVPWQTGISWGDAITWQNRATWED